MKNTILIGIIIFFLATLGTVAYFSKGATEGPETPPGTETPRGTGSETGAPSTSNPAITYDEAEDRARTWIETVSPTYTFDGSALKLTSGKETAPGRFEFTYSFTSNHGGYGDRSGMMVTQVITPHTMDIIYENGAVRSAMTDSTFNELAAVPESATGAMRTVKLFYYHEPSDRDAGGNVGCSPDAVLPVEREIPVTMSPVKDTIALLLKGNVTAAEKAQGFSTEFPNAGFSLSSANLKNGTLTLTFSDKNNFTTGGSCRVGILAAQVRKTAMQFPEVKEVVILPEELFQP